MDPAASFDSAQEAYLSETPLVLTTVDRSVLTLGVMVQQNAALSWRSEMVSCSINKQDPSLIDSAANSVVPLVGNISGIYSRVEEERGI